MDDVIKVLRKKLLEDIAKSEDLVALMRAGKFETFSVEGGKKVYTTEGSIVHQERIIENLKAVIAHLDR